MKKILLIAALFCAAPAFAQNRATVKMLADFKKRISNIEQGAGPVFYAPPSFFTVQLLNRADSLQRLINELTTQLDLVTEGFLYLAKGYSLMNDKVDTLLRRPTFTLGEGTLDRTYPILGESLTYSIGRVYPSLSDSLPYTFRDEQVIPSPVQSWGRNKGSILPCDTTSKAKKPRKLKKSHN